MVAYLYMLRPHQWLKNLILFFPPFLGGSLLMMERWKYGWLSFFSFCLISSATYIFNDIRDYENDRIHPKKRFRAIASGKVSVPLALIIALLLLCVSLVLGGNISTLFLWWLTSYFLVSSVYSLKLKSIPIFDIFCIASGFVIRLFAGGEAFGVRVSDWLFLTVLLLAIFLSCGKRLSEKNQLGESSSDHRKVLEEYPFGVLDGFMFISGAAVLVTYTLYVITKHRLIYTVPLCCFGLFRYILLVKRGQDGDPTDSLLKDPVMFLVGLVWVAMVGFTIYSKNL